MKKRNVIELAVGLLMLVSALYTYIPEPQYMCELTFLSNMAGAGLFIVDGVYGIRKHKQLPGVLFLIETVTISAVFFITVGCTVSGLAHFNFSGGMIFLHVINPILVMGFYLFAEGERNFKFKEIAAGPIFVMVYLLFDYIRSFFVGSFVYGLFSIEEMSFLKAVLVGLVTYIIIGILGLLIYSGGRLVKKLSLKD